MSDQKKITTATVTPSILEQIEAELVANDSFAFTRSIVPILVPVNRSGSIMKKQSAITIFVVAVGDTDAVEEFRKTRNHLQTQVGAVRAAQQNKVLDFNKD